MTIGSDGHLAGDAVAGQPRQAGWEVLDFDQEIAGSVPVAGLPARQARFALLSAPEVPGSRRRQCSGCRRRQGDVGHGTCGRADHCAPFRFHRSCHAAVSASEHHKRTQHDRELA